MQSVEAILSGAMPACEAASAAAESASPEKACGAPQRRVLAGLVGRGIQASRTPGMHAAEGARLGMRYTYKLLDFDALGLSDGALPEVIAWAALRGFAGLNITHPFKESAAESLDVLAPEAASIGAVNTIVLREGRSTGHNTDCWGFAESFRRGMAGARLANVVLIGAGGAGAAVARALLQLGAARLGIHDVDRDKAARLAASLSAAFGGERAGIAENLNRAVAAADGLVNATPIGMAKYPGTPVPPAWLRRDLWVADIVYFPRETELLRTARAAGCRTLAGVGMAVYQAVMAFELITGVKPEPAAMTRHFDSA